MTTINQIGTPTITLGGTLTTSGAFGTTLTMTAGTTITLPTSGTLVNSAVATLSSLASIGTIGTGVWNASTIGVQYGGTTGTSFTAYSVICAGTSATGALQNVSGVGTSGQILTSGGASALPTWSSASIAPTAAVKSDQTTGTSTTLFVNPGVQQYHASSVKAWCAVTVSGSTPTIQSSYNVTSVTNVSTGIWEITFTTGFTTAYYTVSGLVRRNSGDANDGAFPIAVSKATAPTATVVRVCTMANDASLSNFPQWSCTCSGVQ